MPGTLRLISNDSRVNIIGGNLLRFTSGGPAGATSVIGGGVTDHGDLTGLLDDDHPQYATNVELTAEETFREDADEDLAADIAEVAADLAALPPSGLPAGYLPVVIADVDDPVNVPEVFRCMIQDGFTAFGIKRSGDPYPWMLFINGSFFLGNGQTNAWTNGLEIEGGGSAEGFSSVVAQSGGLIVSAAERMTVSSDSGGQMDLQDAHLNIEGLDQGFQLWGEAGRILVQPANPHITIEGPSGTGSFEIHATYILMSSGAGGISIDNDDGTIDLVGGPIKLRSLPTSDPSVADQLWTKDGLARISGIPSKLDFITITQAVDLDALEARVNSLDAAVILRGSWDASAGTFPGSGTAQAGESWIVSVAGTVGGVAFNINDRIIAITDNASTTVFASNWFKADYTDQVLSVNGQTGTVILAKGDVGLGNVDNTSDLNKPVSTAQQAALDLKQNLDSDLTAIAGLTPTNDDVIQRKAGAWTNRSMSQLMIDLVAQGAVQLTQTATKTADYTAQVGELVAVDSTSGAIVITAPAANARDGAWFGVKMLGGNNTITVNRAGTDHFETTTGGTSKSLATQGQILLCRAVASTGVWTVILDPLPSWSDGTYVIPDTSTAGQIKAQLRPDIGANSIRMLNGNTLILDIDYVITGGLPANTYSNGTLGAGATITANANGAMTSGFTDGETPALGDIFFYGNAANTAHQGFYTWSQLGSAGTPWIAVRLTLLDQAAELTSAIEVFIARGAHFGGKHFSMQGGTFVLGTTGFNLRSPTSIGDIYHGPNRDAYIDREEWDRVSETAATVGSLAKIVGTAWSLARSGTGADTVAQLEGTDLTVGNLEITTGTTTTGRSAPFTAGAHSSAFDAFKLWEMYTRLKIPTASDGTNTFRILFGFTDDVTTATPNNFVGFRQSSGVNLEAVCRSGGTETAVDTGTTMGTSFGSRRILTPGDGKVYFWVFTSTGGVAELSGGGISTNLPTAGLFPFFGIFKSAGGTARTLRCDLIRIRMPSSRTGVYI